MSSAASSPQLEPVNNPPPASQAPQVAAPAAPPAAPALSALPVPPPPPALPSPLANPPLVPLDDIPQLYLEIIDEPQEKVECLHIIADSIAQMRQAAAASMVFHPLCLTGLTATLATAYQIGYISKSDIGVSIALTCGILMSFLMGIRYFTSGYITVAEKLNWNWLRPEDGGELDTVLGVRWQNRLIATIVLRLESNPTMLMGRKKKGSLSHRGGRGIIRAWTTRRRFRRRGIGRDLLYEAVKLTKDRCGKDADVGFAREHANSVMLLPDVFNGTFRRRDAFAAMALRDALAEFEYNPRKRR